MDLAELHLPRSVAYVGLARLIVASAARLAGLPDERVEDLKIAVSEATAQAVTAARGREGSLVLAFGPHRGAFEVHLLGGGVLERGGDADAAWSDEHDLRFRLMEGLADEVVFPASAGGQLVLRFVLSAETAVAGATADHAGR